MKKEGEGEQKRKEYVSTNLPPMLRWELTAIGKDMSPRTQKFLADYLVWESSTKVEIGKQYLNWAFARPNSLKDWHFGLCFGEELMAVVGIVPFTFCVQGLERKGAKVACFTLNPAIRTRMPRIIDRIINETRRRINFRNKQLVFYKYFSPISEKFLPIALFRRKIAFKKMCELLGTKPNPLLYRVHSIPEAFTRQFRTLAKSDIHPLYLFLKENSLKKRLSILLQQDQIKFTFWPRPDFLFTYVTDCKGQKGKEIKSLFSFYIVQSKMGAANIRLAKIIALVGQDPVQLLQNAVIAANRAGADLLECDNTQLNEQKLQDLLFQRTERQVFLHTQGYQLQTIGRREIGLQL